MSSEIENKITRVISKLENAQPKFNFPQTTNETQEGNYRMQKRIAGVVNQANISCISSFQEDLNQTPNESNDVSNSFSEMPSESMEQSFHKPNLNRRPSIILDLNKIINIGGYEIELGNLLNILDKKLPEKKENILNDDTSNIYTQCSTEESERRKSFVSPMKKKNDNGEVKKNIGNKENTNQNSNSVSKRQNNFEEIINDKKFNENLPKKYHKIALLLRGYINENKLVNELNANGLKENNICIPNINLNINLNENKNVNCRRRSLFDMSSCIIPSENSTFSYEKKNNQLPNFVSKFFKHKNGEKTNKRKKRNTIANGHLFNKLKQLNQQFQSQNTSKKIPQSEKSEFKIAHPQSSISSDSNIKINNISGKKNISQISNFEMSNNDDSESIIDNENSIYNENENRRTSIIFIDGLSAVKKRRQSDFFDAENIPQQQEEITGFNKMVSTIIEEEDNNNINNNQNVSEEENKKNCLFIGKKDEKGINKKVEDDENEKRNENEEIENGEEDDSDSDFEDEEDDETILNDRKCYNVNNINTSLCFDDCNF